MFERRTPRFSQPAKALLLGSLFAASFVFARPAEAAIDQAFFQSCAASAGSMAIDATSPRVPLAFSSTVGFTVPSRIQNNANLAACTDLTWVKVPTNPPPPGFPIAVFGGSIHWAGRTAANAWDCNHSMLAWGVYEKNSNGTWSYVNGGMSYGNMPAGTTECRYDNSGFPTGFGGFAAIDTNGSSGGEYRIGFYTWSHNDPAFGHSGTDCAYSSCNWPARFELVGVRPPQVNDVATWRPSDGVWSVFDQPANTTITHPLERTRQTATKSEPTPRARAARTPVTVTPALSETIPEASSPLPVVDYGRPEDAVPLEVPPSAEAVLERDQHLAALRESGPGGGEWQSHFGDVGDEWRRIAAREHIAVDVGAWDCSAGGCAITLEFEALADLQTFSSVAILGSATKRWRGAGFRSGPVEGSSGKIAATWIFFAPHRPEATSAPKTRLL